MRGTQLSETEYRRLAQVALESRPKTGCELLQEALRRAAAPVPKRLASPAARG